MRSINLNDGIKKNSIASLIKGNRRGIPATNSITSAIKPETAPSTQNQSQSRYEPQKYESQTVTRESLLQSSNERNSLA